jgi:hypothetical protein
MVAPRDEASEALHLLDFAGPASQKSHRAG